MNTKQIAKRFVSLFRQGRHIEIYHELYDMHAISKEIENPVAAITEGKHIIINEFLENALLELTGILSGSKSYGEEKLLIVPKQEESVNGALSGNMTQFLEDNSWEDEIDEFANIIIKDKPVVQGSSYDALKVMELVYKIYNADDSWNC